MIPCWLFIILYICCFSSLLYNFVFRLMPLLAVLLKRNRVQITGCRATVCCSEEINTLTALHNKPLFAEGGWEGMQQNNKPGYLPEN
jgi:hypothetical protein